LALEEDQDEFLEAKIIPCLNHDGLIDSLAEVENDDTSNGGTPNDSMLGGTL
jgi:hypothetical protein